MKKISYSVLGVMSGTSLDGVDLAHIKFVIENEKWKFTIFENETIKYSEQWVSRLKNSIDFSSDELKILNYEYTELLGKMISSFILKKNILNLDAVCSHGHTILHQPEKGITLQIGNLPNISKFINQKVVCDFRVQDVKLGGQGAPLVPIGDQILFSNYDYCLNLGGFSNISFLDNNKRIAFDISAVNTVLNFYANKFELDYDDKGSISRKGNIDTNLFNSLNTLEFYTLNHPKSLGFEYVKTILLPMIELYKIPNEDKLRTFTEHIALQIAHVLPKKTGRLLITGGGAYNDFLIERIKFYLPKMSIVIPENKIVEYKEALIFALLGVLRLREEINVLSSVTGAVKDHSSGVIFD